MKPEELTALATVLGVIVAALFGTGGLVVGIIGLVQASKARSAATRANTAAGTANTIALEANAIAEKANKVAEDATVVVKKQADRATERSDVAWEWWWDETYPEMVVIRNVGKSLAKDVVVQFTVNTTTEANLPEDVDGRMTVRLEIPGLKVLRKEALALHELQELGGAAGYHVDDALLEARIRFRVTWLTPKGTPKLHDTNYLVESLMPNHRSPR